MPWTNRLRPFLAAAAPVAAAVVLAPTAQAAEVSGGMSAPGTPKVSALKCGTGDQTACPRGYVLRLSGENLDSTKTVLFLGRKGARDDRRARPTEASPHRVLVKVPTGARSGPLKVVTAMAATTTPTPLKVLPLTARRRTVAASLSSAPGTAVFPIQGPYRFGDGAASFGGGRGHEGHDVFADCGTPLVAALGGTVQIVKFHSRAGNYVVIQAEDGTSQAYMHLQSPSPLKKGDPVVAGTPIGAVGDTGRASGCHLHFEHWTAPGWYEGGSPIDPLPLLKAWAAASAPVPAQPSTTA